MNKKENSRRRFLKFMGKGTAAIYAMPLINMVQGCAPDPAKTAVPFNLKPLSPSLEDDLLLAEGFKYDVFMKWDEPINDRGERFGFNCDYIAYIPFEESAPGEGWLWVNHEYPHELFISGYVRGEGTKTKEQAIKELEALGGSILHIKKSGDQWNWIKDSPYNRRITGLTPIPLISERPIQGSNMAIGTFGNCAGGVTPWGTFLSCEENYQDGYGEAVIAKNGSRSVVPSNYPYRWEQHFEHAPEHYGWVVEVDPRTAKAKKLIALGRFAHESATVVQASDGRCVVYSADDKVDEHLYKFIAEEQGSLEKGKLYAANTEEGKWVPLDWGIQPALRKHFTDQTDVLVHVRKAAKYLGATPLDRPEDVAVDPATGAVIVALSYNKPRGNYYGGLLKIVEANNDPLSLEFEADTFLSGGPETGFACPDNLAFDPKGNLWMTTDVYGGSIDTEKYKAFGNNGLFYIPMKGQDAGIPVQIASAPVDAELTGPCFSPDGKTLFLSVQHPGETSKSMEALTSHWPEGGKAIPKPTVVQVSGPGMDALSEP